MVKKRIIVTGGTGYIGSNLLPSLLDNNFEVAVIVRSIKNTTRIPKKIQIYINNNNHRDLENAFESFKPDAVVHLASAYKKCDSLEEIDELINVNINYGTLILHEMDKVKCKHLIIAGSYWQYGGQNKKNGNTLYATSKSAFELISDYYRRKSGIITNSMILYDVYGDDDWRNKFINKAIISLYDGEIIMATPGDQYLDFVNISDVIDAFIALLKKTRDKSNKKYSISTGRLLKLRCAVDIIEIISEKKVNIMWGTIPYPEWQIMRPPSIGSKLKGWDAKISFENGIKKLFKENNCNES